MRKYRYYLLLAVTALVFYVLGGATARPLRNTVSQLLTSPIEAAPTEMAPTEAAATEVVPTVIVPTEPVPTAIVPTVVIPSADAHVSVTVRVQSSSDVERVRGELYQYLFGNEPPTTATCEGSTCSVSMSNGFTSTIAVYTPDEPNGELVIYVTGHAGETPDITETVDALVGAGYTVALFDMPLTGVNPPVTLDLPVYGTVTLRVHDHMKFLDGVVEGSPLRYFIEPVIAYLNAVDGEYDRVIMTGISGGGWTTTLAAALDTRIDISYPIAGTLPLSIFFATNVLLGDYEQSEPTLYAIAEYADLYVMGAAGRRQVQLLNYHDPCCFRGDFRSLYEPQVAAAAAKAGGSFEVRIDMENLTHSLSPAALEYVLADLEATR